MMKLAERITMRALIVGPPLQRPRIRDNCVLTEARNGLNSLKVTDLRIEIGNGYAGLPTCESPAAWRTRSLGDHQPAQAMVGDPEGSSVRRTAGRGRRAGRRTGASGSGRLVLPAQGSQRVRRSPHPLETPGPEAG